MLRLANFVLCYFSVFTSTTFDTAVQTSLIQGRDHDAPKVNETPYLKVPSLFPIRGSELGGTKIVLKGLNFDFEDVNLRCCFNETKVHAHVVSDEEIICYTPPSQPGRVFVQICNVDAESEECSLSLNQKKRLVFEYTIMATVFSLFPSSGSGGNEVDIVGSGFMNTTDLCCRFDSTLTPATYVSPSKIKCLSPTLHDNTHASVLVTVSNNGVDVEGDWASVMFVYTLPPIVTSIDPITSPSAGDTSLFIQGNFPVHGSEHIVVQIGELMVNATRLSTDEIVCKIPVFNVSSPEFMPILVSLNGGNEFNVGVQPRIVVHPPSRIMSVIPASVPETGKSIVRVFGEQFHRSAHLTCIFGNVTVPAIWISNSLLHCEAPPSKPGTVLLGVSTNGQISGFTAERVEFNFTEAVTLTSIAPSSGPFTGGMTVYLYGSGFVSSHLNTFLCRFGNFTVQANQIFNQTTASCVLPPKSFDGVKLIPVDVSVNNGHYFTSSGLQFLYNSFYRIDSIYPRMGPSTGNTTLNIFGDFAGLDFVNVQCQFDTENLKINSIIFNTSDTSLSCFTPSIHGLVNALPVVSHVEIVYKFNGDNSTVLLTDRGASTSSFIFYSRSVLHSLHPTHGSELGGTNVTITGHFTRSHELICKFDERTSPVAHWVSKDTVICTSPPATQNFLKSVVQVSVLINGEDDEGLSLPFQYTVASHISTLTPTFGPKVGGTSVLIEGGGFPVSPQINAFCVFGSILKEAKILSESQAICQSPRSNVTQIVSLSITLGHGNDITSSSAYFTYIEEPSIRGIAPTHVAASQRTQISVFGENFSMLSNGMAWCSFGGLQFAGRVVNENLVTFLSPIVQEKIISRVKVSFNGVDFTSIGPILSIFPSPVITSISPNFSNEDGGTPISIEGHGFYNVPNISCIFKFSTFEHIIVHANYDSFSSLICIAPPMVKEYRHKVSLELSLTGASFDANPSVDVLYYTGIKISSVSPADCSKSGGSALSITGFGFAQQKSSYYCRIEEAHFDPVFVPAEYYSDKILVCKAPPSHSKDRISIAQLSIVVLENAKYYNASGDNSDYASFRYVNEIVLEEVSPNSSSLSGGSNVQIKGKKFVESESIVCSFTVEGRKYINAANFLTDELISCTVPKLPDTISRANTVSLLQVSNYGKEFSSKGLAFHHRQQIVVKRIEPATFPENGSSNVTVIGNNFFRDSTLSCKFGDGSANIATAATYLSNTLLVCPLPAVGPGVYSLTVSALNMVSAKGVVFEVYPQISLFSMTSNEGPFSGGTKIKISGENFPNTTSLQCKFGKASAKALYVSTRQIICITPRQYFNESTDVKVSVSGNGQDFTEYNEMRYLYKDDQSQGYTLISRGIDYQWNKLNHQQVHLKLNEMTPRSGIVSGGQKVILSGSGFYSNPNAACRFGISVANATVLSSKILECVTPIALRPGIVTVDITMNGYDWTDNSFDFSYFIPMDLYDVSPRKLPMYGGTVLHVSGSSIDLTRDLFCNFGFAGMVQAVVSSTNFLSCVSPVASTPGEFSFDVLMEETSILLHGRIKLEFVAQITFSIYPKFGPKEGNTPLSLHINEADSFALESDDVVCSFEFGNGTSEHTTIDSRSVYVNSTHLSCSSPNITDIVTGLDQNFVIASVNLINVAGGFSMTNQVLPTFTFKSLPTNTVIKPRTGRMSGGTRVTLETTSPHQLWLNSNSLTCMFGPSSVRGNWLSKQKVECIAPPVILGNTRVSLSIAENGVDFMTVGYFHYHSPPSILSVDRYHVYEGISSDITITVTGLVTFDTPGCLLWSDNHPVSSIVPAKVMSSTLLKCSFPSRGLGDTIYLRVSNNGDEFSHDFQIIKVIPLPRFVSLTPISGISGESNTVYIKGEYIRENSLWNCVMKGNDTIFNNNATVISASLIHCEIQCPPVFSPQKYEIRLKTSEVEDIYSFMFWCIPKPNITSVFPTRILAHQEKNLTIHGEGFTPYQFLKCVFFGDFGRLQTDSAFVNESTLLCPTPRILSPQMVQFEITNGGMTTLKSNFIIQILPQMNILNLNPQTLVAGSVIKVTVDFGHMALEGMNCRLGGYIGRYIELEDDQTIKCHTAFDLPHGTYTSLDIFSNEFIVTAPADTLLSVVGQSSIQEIHPSKAIRFYRTLIKVTGNSFMGSNATCHFGNIKSVAQIHSDTLISCESPPSQMRSLVQFMVTIDLIPVLNKLTFEYMEPWIISEIFPTSGSIHGGTKVTIHGMNFDQSATDIKCLFGQFESEISAQVISDTLLSCVTPSLLHPQHLTVSFAVADRGNIISIPKNHNYRVDEFYFFDGGSTTSIEANLVDVNGGKEIEVYGSWFYDKQYAYLLSPKCRFDHDEVVADFTPYRSFICSTPHDVVQSLNMTLHVSLNGVDYLDESFLIYNERLVIHSTNPSSGPMHEGILVELVGMINLIDTKHLQCRFGSYPSSYAFTDSSSEKIFCITPTVNETTTLDVYLKFDDQEKWSNTGQKFEFVDQGILNRGGSVSIVNQDYQVENSHLRPDFTLSHVSPCIGPSNGGTKLTVYGTGFESSDDFLCWFGEYATVATYMSSTSISCPTSAYYFSGRQVERVPFSVRSQKFIWMKNVSFYYYRNFLQSDVTLLPACGPTQGGTSVQIKGQVIEKKFSVNSLGPVIRDVDVLVRVGNTIINTSVGDDFVEFIMPPLQSVKGNNTISDHFELSIPIALSINGGLNFIPCPQFNMYETPILVSVHPQVIISGFHSGLIIEGYRFPSLHPNLTCRIGGSKSIGRSETDEVAFCPIPSNLKVHENEMLTTLSISFNEKDFSSDVLSIFIQPAPTITQVTPTYICDDGGTNVNVKGTNFNSIENAGCSVCLFRRTPRMNTCLSINLQSNNEFTFQAPSGFGDNIEIQVGCGTENFNVSNVRLTYVPRPLLHFVTRTNGSIDGGYSIALTGRNFFAISSYSCLIKSAHSMSVEVKTVDAIIVNETALICSTPSATSIFGPSREGVATIQVKRYIDSSVSNEVIFHHMYPTHADELVEVEMKSENEVTDANFHTHTCTPKSSDGEVAITLYPERPNYKFEFIWSSPFIESVDPLYESFHGGSMLLVTGGGFEGNIYCMFGTKSSPAIIVNSTVMECRIPGVYELFESLHLNTDHTLSVPFRFSMERHLATLEDEGISVAPTSSIPSPEMLSNLLPSLMKFTYSEDIEITTITPKSVPLIGETVVRVTGKGFRNSPYLSCKVEMAEARKAFFISSNLIECIVPNAIEALGSKTFGDQALLDQKKAYVFVSNNGKDFNQTRVKNMASFSYYETPSFVDYAPKSGFAGVEIFLHATSLKVAENPLCQFGDIIVQAHVLQPATLICKAPNVPENAFQKTVDIGVSLNGFQFFETGFKFEFIEQPIISHIEPLFGPDVGGNVVRIFGSNFGMNKSILCKFGDYFTNANVHSDGELQCHAPPREAGTIMVSLFYLDQETLFQDLDDYEDTNFDKGTYSLYTYLEDFFIEALVPNYGPNHGNTTVTLFGQNFHLVDRLICIFGESFNEAIFISERKIICSSPPYQIQSNQSVEVRLGISSINNAVTFLSTSYAKSFTYVGGMHIDEIYPSRGLTSGGDKIKVKGGNFVQPLDNKVVCAFGITKTIGKWISSNEIDCITPPMKSSEGLREVQRIIISGNSSFQEFSASFLLSFEGSTTKRLSLNISEENLRFELQSLPTIGDVIVTSSTNYNDNSTESTYIYDVTFTTLGEPANIGDLPLLEVEIFSLSRSISSEVRKIQESCCVVTLSLNYVDYFGGMNGSIVSFTFDDEVLVTNVSPAHGSVHGGTLVILSGEGFHHFNSHSTPLFCVFGTQYIQAQLTETNQVQCLTPTFPTPAKVIVSLELYTDVEGFGRSITSEANFEFVSEPEILETFPLFLPFPSKFRWDVLDVFGRNFIQSDSLGCIYVYEDKRFLENSTLKFELSTNASFHNATYIQCLNDADNDGIFHWKEAVMVHITTNGIDRSKGHELDVVKTHTIHDIFPVSGPKSGGTEVMIQGHNFLNVETLSCRFGGLPQVRAIFQSPEAIKCMTPPKSDDTDGNVMFVEVTNNGYHFAPSSVLFHFYDDIEILSIEPTIGSSVGGTIVNVTLNQQVDRYDYTKYYICRFNETHVSGTMVDTESNVVSCESPPSFAHGGMVSFELSINGFDFSASGFKFLYLPGQRSESLILSPSHGPVDGGTLVKVEGMLKNVIESDKIDWKPSHKPAACKFGDVVVPAENVNGIFSLEYSGLGDPIINFSCRSPHASLNNNASSILVDISLTGAREDFTTIGAVFQYDKLITIAEVNPDTGSSDGGTTVQVHGGPFDDITPTELLCRFGSIIVNGTWINSDVISCVTPALTNVRGNETKSVSVAVSINGADFSLSTRVFHYKPDFALKRLQPNHGYAGSSIVVEGVHFFPNYQYLCHFGVVDIEKVSNKFHGRGVPMAKYLNTTHLVCIAPPHTTVGFVPFYLSIDGTITGVDQLTLLFHYDENISILEVFPTSGPTTGNFSVTIHGGPFHEPSFIYQCKFGSTIVNAAYLSSNHVTCIAPSKVYGIYQLRVTQNGQDFSDDFEMINFYKPPQVDKLFPLAGPAEGAGTQVHFLGTNFINLTTIMCKFDQTPVPAIFVSVNEIICMTPSLFTSKDLSWEKLSNHSNRPNSKIFPEAHIYPLYLSKLVQVEVSMNGQDFTDIGHTFLFQDDMHVGHLIPSEGPSVGGTPVFIHGSGFVNSTFLSCRFGHHIGEGRFLTTHLVLCFSPPHSHVYIDSSVHDTLKMKQTYLNGPVNGELEVFVEVSNNAVDFTDFQSVFRYLPTIQEGFFQPGVDEFTVLRCPRGSYCRGDLNFNFTLCPRGTYQPLPGQTICTRCPIGFMCPEQGLPVPRICPAGFVCDVTGVENAIQPCPAGFYCPPGTVTSATSCGNRSNDSNKLSATLTLAERSTVRQGHIPLGNSLVTGGRASMCWDNSTDDYGLQMSSLPSRFWDEIRTLPLDIDTSVAPIRGRYCQDDSCLKVQDMFEASILSPFTFDSTNIHPQQPIPCPPGTYCHPGSSTHNSKLTHNAAPIMCDGKNYCPEATGNPAGVGECPLGFFCRFGKKRSCPIGTFCPFSNMWDPLPCEPGTFNFMVGQSNCTSCPLGHYCSGYGKIEPSLCPPGFVCSKAGLVSPNIRCPPGFYCPSGTQTSDPFRNDTTLRPYPCAPGTYCLGGVGYPDVMEGNFSHAQPCPPGFFCESASISAKGSGLCPPGFFCPKGTATPKPTPKGHYAKLLGTIHPAVCLPGFYAPTIESTECIPCPPGTACEVEGLFSAEICPPGSFRSTLEVDGIACQTCPQGTWSKNWHLRDEGECNSCPTGIVCPIDGMTVPCSKHDLPTPYEPVLNLDGIPVLEFKFSSANAPPPFSIDECLQLNFASNDDINRYHDPHYFFGELIPPYIDILGRGSHIRITDKISTKYNSSAKCYRNLRPRGSIIYERMATYYGPQYDIQTGYPHQGYGSGSELHPMFTTLPFEGVDDVDNIQYFFGKGTMYIDLPRFSVFDPMLNCTKGFSLMNSTLEKNNKQIVYTSSMYDYEGGIDVLKCSVFDQLLNCFIDPTHQLHLEGECCSIRPWTQRAIYLAEDQYYSGTCEADIICSDEELTEAAPCQDGFVCADKSTSQSGTSVKCPAGYICPFGTTPDDSLEAPQGHYANICPQGYHCADGTGLDAADYQCPLNHYCPTGTSDPMIGVMANDGLNRGLKGETIDPDRGLRNLVYFGEDSFKLLSDHESKCISGIDITLENRFSLVTDQSLNNAMLMNENHSSKPRGENGWSMIRDNIKYQIECARDSKWKLIKDAVKRGTCDCNSQMFIIIAVYRLWQVNRIYFCYENFDITCNLCFTFDIFTVHNIQK